MSISWWLVSRFMCSRSAILLVGARSRSSPDVMNVAVSIGACWPTYVSKAVHQATEGETLPAGRGQIAVESSR